MLGYKYTDVIHMQMAITEAIHWIPSDDKATKDDLYRALDFLQGLIVEGHVQ